MKYLSLLTFALSAVGALIACLVAVPKEWGDAWYYLLLAYINAVIAPTNAKSYWEAK